MATEGVRKLRQSGAAAGARPIKRSFVIAGHRTSVSLEAAFWTSLKVAALDDGMSLSALVSLIDEGRANAGLSSAIRVWLLQRAEARAAEAVTWSSS